jgi:thiosulfate/3-mercaptopyruvate sulfurtransferase
MRSPVHEEVTVDAYIEPAQLAELLAADDAEVRIVDVRWALNDDEAGHAAYLDGHLPGAVYLGWLTDWSDPDDPVPGQLARPADFARTMGAAGIGPDTVVVAYDDGQLYLASRLSWALRHYGHREVRVLAGGYPAWVAAGLPISTEAPAPDARDYPVPEESGLRVTKSEVLAAVQAGETPIVDCRMESTYVAAGEHIPGATRLPAPELFDPDTGRVRDADELRAMAERAGLRPEEPGILYCGGGVSASAAFIALREIGYARLRVYDGSWSEWSADPDTPRTAH